MSTHASFRLLRTHHDLALTLGIVAVAITYYLAAKLGLSLAFSTEQVTAFWPPTGIALAVLLLAGSRMWPGIYIGAFLANVTSDEAFLTAAGIALGNTLAGLCGAYLLRSRCRFHSKLERTRDVMSLVGVAMLSTTISATLGTLNLAIVGLVDWQRFLTVWRVWWTGDTLGILLITPFILTWAAHRAVRWRGLRLVEYGALHVGAGIVSLLVFSNTTPVGDPLALMAYAVFPFLLWAAFRFETRDIVTCQLIIVGTAVGGAINGRGPFAIGTLDERLLSLDLFAAMTGVTGLLLGAVTAERRRSQERLRHARNEMERRVLARTSELERANQELYEFSYSMSHDLRAPLRAVNAFSELLSAQYGHTLDTEGQRYVRGIAKNSAQMARMMDDYLRLFRLRSEPLALRSIDMSRAVAEIIGQMSGIQSWRRVRFDVGALPIAYGDPGLIQQVLVNLLDNAVKFSSKSEQPHVEVCGNEGIDNTMYSVKDNGVGFDTQWSDQLFKVFQRLHPREFDGLGVGLAIVASIVQRHGGSVAAQGVVNGGATFSFSLPRTVAA